MSNALERLGPRLAFARASNPDDELFVINFADKPHIDVEMTSDIRVLEAGIARADSIAGTPLLDAVQAAEIHLQQRAKSDSLRWPSSPTTPACRPSTGSTVLPSGPTRSSRRSDYSTRRIPGRRDRDATSSPR